MSRPRPIIPYSDAVGERRRGPSGTVWTIFQQLPHRNGDPAYLRVRSENGTERTIYAVDWSMWGPA